MNREKLVQAQQELRAPAGMLIVYVMDFIHKPIPEGAIITEDPKEVSEWKVLTDFHPHRAIVVSSGTDQYKADDVIYIDGQQRNRWSNILHRGEKFVLTSLGFVLSGVTGPGAEELLDIVPIPKTKF